MLPWGGSNRQFNPDQSAEQKGRVDQGEACDDFTGKACGSLCQALLVKTNIHSVSLSMVTNFSSENLPKQQWHDMGMILFRLFRWRWHCKFRIPKRARPEGGLIFLTN